MVGSACWGWLLGFVGYSFLLLGRIEVGVRIGSMCLWEEGVSGHDGGDGLSGGVSGDCGGGGLR
jgi:hypothetical protein